jgi:hypothetical protein
VSSRILLIRTPTLSYVFRILDQRLQLFQSAGMEIESGYPLVYVYNFFCNPFNSYLYLQ